MTIFQGVLPAITTPFRPDGQVDHPALAAHARWLLSHDCTGLVPCGSLGEGAALEFAEKVAVIRTCVEAAGGLPVIPGIAVVTFGSCSTHLSAALQFTGFVLSLSWNPPAIVFMAMTPIPAAAASAIAFLTSG